MLVLKNHNMSLFSKKTHTISLLLLLCSATNLVCAKTVNVISTQTYIENTTYYLDTIFDLTLTEEADKALRHGIALEIHAHFQLRLKREWFWNKTISEKKLIYKLEYRPLTKNFLATNLNTGLRSSFSNLDSTLNHINSISKMELFDTSMQHADKNYIARIKMFLDIGSLPPPMRPQAYFSSSWDISSKWFEWEISYP